MTTSQLDGQPTAPPDAPATAEPTTTVSDVPAAVPRRPRRRLRWPQLGIQSKVLLMLLATSIISCVVVGVVGYRSGRDALRDKAFEQLTFVRNSRARGLVREFTRLQNQLAIFTRGKTAIDGVQAFTDAFAELADSELSDEEDAALQAYYDDVFVDRLDANLGTTSLADAFVPTAPAQQYLQTHYTVPYDGDFDAMLAVDDAGDGSAWSAVHAEYHEFFRDLVERFSYEDAMLIDPDGNIVYSAYKGVDLGTNLADGPYSRTLLADAYNEAMESNAVDFVVVTEFERYQPSYGVPTVWAVSPIGEEDEIVGVLALQISLDAINRVMTGNQDWVVDGLGESGETYLVGRDFLMRSTARLVVEEPEAYERAAVRGGASPADAARAARAGDTILVQRVDTAPVRAALRGETGDMVTTDYYGNEALSAYAPVELGDLDWVIVAELDTDEAFAPVDDFTRRLVLATAAIIVAVALASLLLAQIFSRPVKRLMVGVNRVAGGDLGAQVASSSTDEFADLASAFNDMSRSLRTKQELLEAEQAENERLLLTMMPQPVAQRYRRGEETISEDHQDVAVVFADVVGFDEYASGLDSTTSLAQLNDIVRQFDEAAERIGVERVRTLRSGYLASCGLLLPRVDNALRVLDFAREMCAVIERFNAANGTNLSLRAGVDAGRVTSGLVGRASVLYDMWGDAVNLAQRVQGSTAQAGIYVTQRVYDRLRDAVEFEPAGAVDVAGGSQSVWRVA